jgi:tetratricopeptide (TPR) repeat protein
MSLLLEALKKAELAKQSSLGSAPQAEEPAEGGLNFEEPAEPAVHKLATIDFTPPVPEPAATATAAPAPAPADPEPVAPAPRAPRPAPPSEPAVASAPAPDPQRAAARQLFDVKEVDYNPKRPFYITLGVLGLAAVGYGVYLWWQLRPPATVNAAAIQNAPKSAPVARVPPPAPPTDAEAAPGAEPSATPANAETAASAPAAAAAPGAAAAAKPAPAAAAGAPASAPTPSTFLRQGQATAAAKPPAAGAAPAATPPAPVATTAAPPRAAAPRAPRLPITVTPPAFKANEVLESAYAAFQRGEFDRARSDYQQVLMREANNRDALLGLAAIDVRTRDYATAELRYLKLLELDPRDTHANAALIALQGNIDPVQSQSRIKNLIAMQPEAKHLYFTLGNQYAAQARWAEAQDAYFKAFSAEPENADFAFNLAVSLDHLRQHKLASEYYRKAVSLAGSRPVGFDRAQAETRVRELEQ